MKRVLLVEPDFPIAHKSLNHKNFLPIGLLKIASHLRKEGAKVILARGIPEDPKHVLKLKRSRPDEIWVTSLFTYWAEYVKDAVQHYKNLFPGAKVVVGGIMASLLTTQEVRRYTGCDKVHQGIIPEAEKCFPAYDLLTDANPHPVDYQIIHASRGCDNRCRFCGTWKIEPRFVPQKTIKDKIRYGKLVFYDNNLLANPHIEKILSELSELKQQGRIQWCESQSGFDRRILIGNPHMARLIKEAGFRYPRIAWDGQYRDYRSVKRELDLFADAGYGSREIYVFMLYNWDLPFEEMEKKRIKCWEWKVQIADCRYRPLDQLFDDYRPLRTDQTSEDYYIHEKAGWSDALVKQFRANVRRQNICVRQNVRFYSSSFERMRVSKAVIIEGKKMRNKAKLKKYLKKHGAECWFPAEPG